MTMPNFLMIGAPKAGTSSIYYYLKQHPQIYMSPEKEPHFFALENQNVEFKGPGDQQRFRNAVTRLEDYQKLFESVSGEIAIGEASTTYLSSATAANRIKHYLPHAKLIAILRNPVDAAYASFLHLIRDGDETITNFAMALQAEENRFAQNWEGIWHYKRRGFYYAQIKRYFELFEKEQLRIYRYEDFKANSTRVLQDIFQFLEVDDQFTPDQSAQYNVSGMPKSSTLNQLLVKPNPLKSVVTSLLPQKTRGYLSNRLKDWNFNQYQKPQLSLAVRQSLLKEYREDILKLQDLTKLNLSEWLN